MSQNSSNKDHIIKSIGVVVLSLIVLAVISRLPGGNDMGYGQGVGYGGSGIFVILTNLLSLLVVVFIFVGLLVAVKKQNLELDFLYQLFDGVYSGNQFCSHCGTKIEKDWKHCPVCSLTLKKDSSDIFITSQKKYQLPAAVQDGVKSESRVIVEEVQIEVTATTAEEVSTEEVSTEEVYTEEVYTEEVSIEVPVEVKDYYPNSFREQQDREPGSRIRKDKTNRTKKNGKRSNEK